MEEALEERDGGWVPLFEAKAPEALNPSASLVALKGRKKEARAAGQAFSCTAFCIEEGEEGAWCRVQRLPGGGALVSMRLEKSIPLPHALMPFLPEDSSLTVFDPGRVKVESGLLAMCSCYVTDAGSREVLRNFEALGKADKKVIDLSWERTREWRERALPLFSKKGASGFSIEAGRLDAGVLLLAGWIREEFSSPARIVQAPSFESSISKIQASAEGGKEWIRETEGGGAFEIGKEGGVILSAPKGTPDAGGLLVRQMGFLPPDPLYRKCLSLDLDGAEDVG